MNNEQRRLTVDMIRGILERHPDWLIDDGDWFIDDNCLCPMAACWADAGCPNGPGLRPDNVDDEGSSTETEHANNWCDHEFGESYVDGFTSAFDGNTLALFMGFKATPRERTYTSRLGFVDGRSARKAFIAEPEEPVV